MSVTGLASAASTPNPGSMPISWLTGSLCTCVSRINNVLIDLNTKSMIYLLCVKRYTN